MSKSERHSGFQVKINQLFSKEKKIEITLISGILAKTHLDRKSALNEANVLKIMDHPNIIRYECNFEIEGNLHLMMEYADKGALSTYISVDIFSIFHICVFYFIPG